MNTRKRISTIMMIVVTIVIVFGCFFGYRYYVDKRMVTGLEKEIENNSLTDPNGISVKIVEDTTFDIIVKSLTDKGVIEKPNEFRKIATENKLDTAFQLGEYRILPKTSYKEILMQLARQSLDAIVKVTIPEGFELKQIVERLEKNNLVTKEKFYQEMETVDYSEFAFLSNIDRDNKLEGYLFPATYEFKLGAGEKLIIDTMLKRFEQEVTDEYLERAKALNMSLDDVIVLASIIERESGNADESALVSGVFHNRLNDGIKLESCATVQYILGERKPILSLKDTKIDSPYNTYINKGLPLGPIASPGRASIEAALYPEKTEFYFFVLGKDGKHIYSKTYEEHLANQAAANE